MSAEPAGLAHNELMQEATTVGAKTPTARKRFEDLLKYRELLVNLVRKELKVKYKNSALGFGWSFLNPILHLVIFWAVFEKFLGAGVPHFPIFLLSGLLAWNLFSASLGGSVSSIVGNASLVTKVFFPREVLPLSIVGASIIHFGLQFLVLAAGLVVFNFPFNSQSLYLIPVALVALVLLSIGVGLFLAVSNVYLRDVQHLVEFALISWFWMTPIVYPISIVEANLGGSRLFDAYLLNPLTHIALAFQRGLYGIGGPSEPAQRLGAIDISGAPSVLLNRPDWWYLRNVSIVAVASAFVVAIGWYTFRRLESRMAEEL